MTKTVNVKTDFIQPIAVLTAICLVCSVLLAYINSITEKVIADTENSMAQEAMGEVLPGASGFTKLDVELPATYDDGTENFVTAVYQADSGEGYVFMITGNGYGGNGTMKLITSVDPGGSIIATQTLQHAETAGVGSKTTEEDYRSRWAGVNLDSIDSVDGITGASVSSGHYLNSMRSVFQAYAYITK